ncbi:hypothetical protein SAMN05421509_10741 [Chromohalobacter canadensis]|uniref:Uncharacterized protein n=1 Tax=Chromohalobacter canadensis TaxID=141389 RepID=A0A285VQU7_9GAMM|nr:hypothetical protein [Chromohalobacter canadensis]SOC56439.1 hypothetical protein SAMN05421509_10741 [Chromohalobacter canadensis]
MYQDQKRIRRHKLTIYMDDYEAAIVEAHANYSGIPKAQMMREMMFESATEVLSPSVSQPVQSMVAKRGT